MSTVGEVSVHKIIIVNLLCQRCFLDGLLFFIYFFKIIFISTPNRTSFFLVILEHFVQLSFVLIFIMHIFAYSLQLRKRIPA